MIRETTEDAADGASSARTLRYGLIGTGAMGQGHVGSRKAVEGVDIVAIADPHRPSRKAALDKLDHAVSEYDDYHRMLGKEELDAVVIATPNVTRRSHAANLAGSRSLSRFE